MRIRVLIEHTRHSSSLFLRFQPGGGEEELLAKCNKSKLTQKQQLHLGRRPLSIGSQGSVDVLGALHRLLVLAHGTAHPSVVSN